MTRRSAEDPNYFIDPEKIYEKLEKLSAIDRIRMATKLIELCRDVLMVDLATIRRIAALEARKTMRPREIADAAQSSPQTVNRLLTEASALYRDKL